MTNPNGTRFASAVAGYLQTAGFPYAERRAQGGRNDRGDIAGIPGVVLECKATRELGLAAAVDEAAIEARNDGASIYAAVIKRRQKNVADAYMIMPLKIGAELLRDPDVAELAALRALETAVRAFQDDTWEQLGTSSHNLNAALARLDAARKGAS